VISYVDSKQRYVFNNKAYEEWFGQSPNEIVGRRVREVLGEDGYERIHGRIEAALSGEGQSFEYELTLRSDKRHISATYIPDFGEQGEVKGVFVLGIDITERKRMEERLLRAERLAAIGETAAMVGHDLRNPLQAISTATYVLRKELTPTEKPRQMLKVIEDSVLYSDRIVRDLLEYSQELKLEPSETTPKSMVNDAVRQVDVPRNITISDLTSDETKIRVDTTKIRRVFVNLIEDAVDAMPEGGKLTISSNTSDNFLNIKFTDTGLGIPEAVLRDLWKPLVTTKPKGIGLGLAICKRIAEAHGGSITVESKVGEGTTFTLTLPISQSQGAESA
jgi:PAS domain S-box-containing protein